MISGVFKFCLATFAIGVSSLALAQATFDQDNPYQFDGTNYRTLGQAEWAMRADKELPYVLLRIEPGRTAQGYAYWRRVYEPVPTEATEVARGFLFPLPAAANGKLIRCSPPHYPLQNNLCGSEGEGLTKMNEYGQEWAAETGCPAPRYSLAGSYFTPWLHQYSMGWDDYPNAGLAEWQVPNEFQPYPRRMLVTEQDACPPRNIPGGTSSYPLQRFSLLRCPAPHYHPDWAVPNFQAQQITHKTQSNSTTARSWNGPFICVAGGERSIYVFQKFSDQLTGCQANQNPCLPGTGEKVRWEFDFAFAGHEFTRVYRSHGSRAQRSGFGPLWTHSLDTRVIASDDGLIYIQEHDGGITRLVSSYDGSYREPTQGLRYLSATSNAPAHLLDKRGQKLTFDADGLLTSIVVPEDVSRSIEIERDYLKRISALVDATGRRVEFSYVELSPGDHRIQQIDLPDGTSIGYQFNSEDLLESVIREDESVRSYVYDDPTRNPSALKALLTSIETDVGTVVAKFSYDASGRVTSSKLIAEGTQEVETYTLEYPSRDFVRVTNPLGGIKTYQFDPGAERSLRSIESADGTETRNYNSEGLLESVLNRKDVLARTNYVYSGGTPREQVIEDENGLLSKVTLEWDVARLRLASQTTFDVQSDQPVARTEFDYDGDGALTATRRIDPATGEIRQVTVVRCSVLDTVNPGTGCALPGQTKSLDGPRSDVNDVTDFAYYRVEGKRCSKDSVNCEYRRGDLRAITDALGNVTTFELYDGAGRPRRVRDAVGTITELTYDARGRISMRIVLGSNDATSTDDAVTQYTYWPSGKVRTVTSPDGDWLEHEYDGAERLVATSNARGERVELTLDAAGNRTLEVVRNASGVVVRRVSRTFNELGQLHKQFNPDGLAVLERSYDPTGRLAWVKDAYGVEGTQTHDNLNRLEETVLDVNGVAATTAFAYGALDTLKQVTDPKGLVTTYTYNGFRERTSVASPDAGLRSFTYDASGNVATETDARGVVLTYRYDALNRIMSVAHVDPALNVTYFYDEADATTFCDGANSAGRLTRVVSPVGTWRYCYDGRGNVVAKEQSLSVAGQSHEGGVYYSYTLGDRIREMSIRPAYLKVQWTRDAAGQVSAARVDENWPCGGNCSLRKKFSLISNVTYAPFDGPSQITWRDGIVLSRTRNLSGDVTGITSNSAEGLNLTLTQDAGGRLVGVSEAGPSSPQSFEYEHDALARLGAVKAGGVPFDTYQYDSVGNRLSNTSNGSSISYVYAPDRHWLASVDGVARSHDPAGNTIAIGDATLQYDAAGRLSSFELPGKDGIIAAYAYSPWGERVAKTVNGATTFFVYDEAGRLVSESDPQETKSYVFVDDLPAGLIRSKGGATSAFAVHADHLGTPRAIVGPLTPDVSGGGTIMKGGSTGPGRVWEWPLTGSAFGMHSPNEDVDGDGQMLSVNLRFPGQYYDVESGLHYNRYRNYDASSGRYVESDPLGLDGGVSTYGYAGQSPLMFTDPSGLKVGLRCRSVGAPFNPGLRAGAAAALGGEHCYLTVKCPSAGIPDSHISYPDFVSTAGSPPTNDRLYSSEGRYRELPLMRPRENPFDCLDCDFERCLYNYANILGHQRFRISNYSIFGPNSNSFVRRLVEVCGGQVGGKGPPTGWDDADAVGF